MTANNGEVTAFVRYLSDNIDSRLQELDAATSYRVRSDFFMQSCYPRSFSVTKNTDRRRRPRLAALGVGYCGLRSGVRPSVCPSVTLSHQSNAAAASGWFAAERRTRNRYRSTAPAAAAPQPGSAARRSAANEGNVMLTAELTRLNPELVLLSTLGLLQFQECSLLVWNLCPDSNMHGIIYRHIGRTGLGWIDGQKISRISSWKI